MKRTLYRMIMTFFALLLPVLWLAMGGAAYAAGPYNATSVGTPAYTAAATGFGQAVTLNGTTQYVSLAEPGPLDIQTNATYTIEARFKTTSSSGVQVIVGHNTGFYIGLSSGKAVFTVGGLSPVTTTGSATLSDGAWHTLAVVLLSGAGGATYYVDGVSVGTSTGTNNGFGGSTSYIGGWSSAANYFNGAIDEVSISNVAQYSANYTPASAPFSASRSGQIALYHLDGDATDANTNGNSASATAFTLTGPASGYTSQVSGAFTAQPNGPLATSETITLSDGGAGGTFSTGTSLSFSSGSSTGQTFTYTPASVGTKILTATASPALGTAPTASYVVTGQTLLLGTLTVTPAASGVTLSLSSALNGGSGSGYSYSLYRDVQPAVSVTGTPLVINATLGTTPYTDATATRGTLYWYKVVGTDSAGNFAYAVPAGLTGVSAASALAVSGQTLSGVLNLVFGGDSITFGATLATPSVQAPPAIAAQHLAALGGIRAVYYINQGYSGHTLTDFLPATNTDFAAMEAAATNLQAAHPAGQLIFYMLLSTNDSATSGPNGPAQTPAQVTANTKTITSRLLTDYPAAKVLWGHPPVYSPNTQTSFVYGESGLARLVSYYPAIDTAVAAENALYPGHVFVGDTIAPAFFAANYAAEQTTESGANGNFFLHPNAAGAFDLGRLESQAIYSTINPATGTKRRLQ